MNRSLPSLALGLILAASTEGGTQGASFTRVSVQAAPSAHIAGASQPVAVVSGDWNADGKVDLAVADSASNRVSVLLGDGSTTFSQTVDFTVGVSPIALIAADLNLDGTTDLAVLNAGSRTVTLLAGNATTFTTARTISIGGAGHADRSCGGHLGW
jgi:hypothetical protein